MAFRSRDEYEAWKRRAGVPAPVSPSTPVAPIGGEPGEVVLRLSPLYGALVLGAGAIFAVLGLGRFGKGGPAFYRLCLVAGLLAIACGIWMLRRRGIVARMTASALQLQGVTIPWTQIRSVERVRDGRRYWVGVYLTTPRTDLDGVALKARALMRATGRPGADFDYSILETDLPGSGTWFVDECRRRMAAAAR